MDFLKKNYEKVLLGAVLLGLAVAVGFLPFKISSEKQSLADLTGTILRPKAKPLTNLDLSLPQSALQRVAAPVTLSLAEPNKLFNPMPWLKAADGHLVKLNAANVGPQAITITEITPLYTRLKLDSVTMVDSPRYYISIERQAEVKPNLRRGQSYCKIGDKIGEDFILREAQGLAENPTNMVAEVKSSGERVSFSKERAFERIDGYTADLKYTQENKVWPERRVGNTLSLDGKDYKIVAITKDEVILLASSGKKTTIKKNATP